MSQPLAKSAARVCPEQASPSAHKSPTPAPKQFACVLGQALSLDALLGRIAAGRLLLEVPAVPASRYLYSILRSYVNVARPPHPRDAMHAMTGSHRMGSLRSSLEAGIAHYNRRATCAYVCESLTMPLSSRAMCTAQQCRCRQRSASWHRQAHTVPPSACRSSLPRSSSTSGRRPRSSRRRLRGSATWPRLGSQSKQASKQSKQGIKGKALHTGSS